jgi:hypothetical protein
MWCSTGDLVLTTARSEPSQSKAARSKHTCSEKHEAVQLRCGIYGRGINGTPWIGGMFAAVVAVSRVRECRSGRDAEGEQRNGSS